MSHEISIMISVM